MKLHSFIIRSAASLLTIALLCASFSGCVNLPALPENVSEQPVPDSSVQESKTHESNDQNPQSENSAESSAEPEEDPDKVYTMEELTVDKMASGCSGCEKLIIDRAKEEKVYNAIIDLRSNDDSSINTDVFVKKLDSVMDGFVADADHECTCKVINVKDIPYIFGQYRGYYTGQWQGCCPTGEGTFSGTHDTDIDRSEEVKSKYFYTGKWKNGLPDGEGQFHFEIYGEVDGKENRFTNDYVGEMSKGRKDGTGTEYILEYNITNGECWNYSENFYDTGTYSNGKLVGKTGFVCYDDKGEVKYIGNVQESNESKDSWSPDYWHMETTDLSYDRDAVKKQQQDIDGLYAAGFVASAINTIASVYTNRNKYILEDKYGKLYAVDYYDPIPEEITLSVLHKWEDKREEDRKYEEQIQKEADSKTSKWADTMYKNMVKVDPQEKEYQTQFYKAYSVSSGLPKVEIPDLPVYKPKKDEHRLIEIIDEIQKRKTYTVTYKDLSPIETKSVYNGDCYETSTDIYGSKTASLDVYSKGTPHGAYYYYEHYNSFPEYKQFSKYTVTRVSKEAIKTFLKWTGSICSDLPDDSKSWKFVKSGNADINGATFYTETYNVESQEQYYDNDGKKKQKTVHWTITIAFDGNGDTAYIFVKTDDIYNSDEYEIFLLKSEADEANFDTSVYSSEYTQFDNDDFSDYYHQHQQDALDKLLGLDSM